MKKSEDIRIVFFTGAGMSAESGVPTYRGRGGIWNEYKWEDYACERAFNKYPMRVLDFHELRRIEALKCKPHKGHEIIRKIENNFKNTTIITQNIDGMHQRAFSNNVIELHGSLWKLRCTNNHIKRIEDLKSGQYYSRYCNCGSFFRPDIVWFQDMLNIDITKIATDKIENCNYFISIGTSGVVWPAAGFPNIAKKSGAYCIEINPEKTELSTLYDDSVREVASIGLEYIYKKIYIKKVH